MFRSCYGLRSLLLSVAVAFALPALLGCAVVDDVTLRAETMNRSMGDYGSYAILLNIVRAKRHEPLNFVAVVGGAPNGSVVGTAAFPNLSFNPYHLVTTAVTGNSASATASNLLAVSAVDDPGSIQAMLTPIDVATIGFFIKQSYPRELLLRLFIDRLIVVDTDGAHELINDPSSPTFGRALKALLNLTYEGLTVEIARGSSKVGDNPSSQICFNRADAELAQEMAAKTPLAPGHVDLPLPPAPGDRCGPWLQGQVTQSSNTDSAAGIKAKAPPKANPEKPRTWYDVPRNPAGVIKFSTRSAFAVYQYLGSILETGLNYDFLTTGSDTGLVKVSGGGPEGCFAYASYKGESYCVPDDADNMKRTFAILHQVAGLNIVHSSTPAGLAVRTVP